MKYNSLEAGKGFIILVFMPELPEVEIVKRGMEPAMVGRTVEALQLNRPDLRFPIPPSLPENLQGQKIDSLKRRGKYILGFCENGAGFVLHLGMSGVIRIYETGEDYGAQKHDHVLFKMHGGGLLVFNDPRRFGFLNEVHLDNWQACAPFDCMGPEPLGNDFNGPVLEVTLTGRRSPIKTALLDQSIVAGLGNIYVCEALFMAGIHPEEPAGNIQGKGAEKLACAIKDVLRQAIEAGGSSLRDYRNTKGKLGYFQHHFSVYDRQGRACPGCACDTEKDGGVRRIVQGGRSTFYCPQKQCASGL